MHPCCPKRINHALGDRPVETEERAAGDRELIRTVAGRGYQFTGEIRVPGARLRSTLGVRIFGQRLMNQLDAYRAFSHRRCHALDRPGAHVAGGKYARTTRLEQVRSSR
jgi:hypothetical protein